MQEAGFHLSKQICTFNPVPTAFYNPDIKSYLVSFIEAGNKSKVYFSCCTNCTMIFNQILIFFQNMSENTDNFHTDNNYQNYHTDKSILINFMKVNFTDKTQTDKNWEAADRTDKTINFSITKLLIKKKKNLCMTVFPI